MNLLKCPSCGDTPKKEGAVYICQNCGEAFKENEIVYLKDVEPALRIIALPDNRIRSQLTEEGNDRDGLFGETLSSLSSDDTLVFDNGEQKKIIYIRKISQINLTNKRISIAPNEKVSVSRKAK